MNFFQALAKCRNSTENISFTIISGRNFGEKSLFSGGNAVFISHQAGLLAAHSDTLANIHTTGIFPLEDSLVYAEKTAHNKHIIICGAGHVSMPVIRLAKTLSFHVTVIDDRAPFAENARLAGADAVICAEFPRALQEVAGDSDTYFIVVTRGHAYDSECLREILKKPRAYVGMMGSRRRAKIVREKLSAEGCKPDDVAGIHTPIGLAINAQTPEEIAVSILAEIIQIKNQTEQVTFPDEILRFILEHEQTAKILCTIVAKQGAGPRDVGTKMLYTNSQILGTIGGGLMEATIIQKADQILRGDSPAPVLLQIELNADEASREGEVCGGVIQVLLERV